MSEVLRIDLIANRIRNYVIFSQKNMYKDIYSNAADTKDNNIDPAFSMLEKKYQDLLKKQEEKLKENENYSIEIMGQILSTLKKRYAHKDKYWYARYHSGNLKYKQIYLEKIDIRLAQM